MVKASTFDKRNAKNPFKNPKIDLKLRGKMNKNIKWNKWNFCLRAPTIVIDL